MIKSFLIVYKMLLENSRSSFMEFISFDKHGVILERNGWLKLSQG